jgi:hypothetical protein
MERLEPTELSEAESRRILEGLAPWPMPSIGQVRDAVLDMQVLAGMSADASRRERDLATDLPADLRDVVRAGRLFNLGHLPNRAIISEGRRAAALMSHNHIGHPFRRAYALFHTWEQGGSLYLVVPRPSYSHPEIPAGTFLICEFQPLLLHSRRVLIEADCAMLYLDAKTERYIGQLLSRPLASLLGEHGSSESLALCNLADPVLACLLLLATAGVPVRRIETDAKLQRARIKSGKPAIPPHWQVDAADYITALRPRSVRGDSLGGHHASPRPHLRRGHLRHLHERHGGGTTWIRDALVNLKDGLELDPGRSFYEMQRAAGEA